MALVKPLSDGSLAICFVNFGDKKSEMSLQFWDMGISYAENIGLSFYNCYTKQDEGKFAERYVAQVERENIHRRQAEGIAAARARGVRFGRPRKPCPPQFELVRDSYEAGDITRSQAAKCLGVCVGTFDRWMREAG